MASASDPGENPAVTQAGGPAGAQTVAPVEIGVAAAAPWQAPKALRCPDSL